MLRFHRSVLIHAVVVEEFVSKDWRNFYLINHSRNLQQISAVVKILREEKIEPVLIKGWVVAQYYPFFSRLYSDIDLCVAPKDYERALKVLEKHSLQVDLHKGLKHLDSLSWDDLFANSKIIETEKGSVRVLREEDHLRVLCVHWLTDGGSSRERLKDIYYLIKNRSEGFDWDRFLNVVSPVRRGWIECVIGITDIYLNLQKELKNTPVVDASSKVPKWMLSTLEKTWKRNIRLIPLHLFIKHPRLFLDNPKSLFQQVRLRLPPNPIQAMVEVEGSITANKFIIFFYQLNSFFLRLRGFIQRAGKAMLDRVTELFKIA